MLFNKFIIQDWQQFGLVDINFHERLTILTGANGSGKTTILNILARHCGWNTQPLATPTKDKILRVWTWITHLFNGEENQNSYKVGELKYSNNSSTEIRVPIKTSVQYSVEFTNQQPVECFYIPSHRSVFRYQRLESIKTQNIIDRLQAFNKVSNSTRQMYQGNSENSSSFYMKETLVYWNVFGRGNDVVEADEKLLEYHNGFEDILKIVVPKEIGFRRFSIKNFEVLMECDSGNFLIDACSGGLSAIIDMAWQIYMFSSDKNEPFTVLIDEIENHLHPTMQRRILPDFLKAFPNACFIVSTHSPLIVGSVKNSEIYVLKHDQNKIISKRLDLLKEAKTASEILDEVLGVSFTMPIWAEEKLNEIIDKYSSIDIGEDTFQLIRRDLTESGLEKLMPKAITGFIDKNDKTN